MPGRRGSPWWPTAKAFRTLKTKGFDVEGLHIDDAAPRDKLVTAALIAAVALQQMVHARVGGPGPLRPCTCVFQSGDLPLKALCRLEGKTERQCARLGGWTGCYGKPGPIVMPEGWLEFQANKRSATLLVSGHNV